MGKLKEIWTLYDSISAKVIQSSSAWEEYLCFASGIYKYKFDNALLIYAQRPDATMVADKTTWEEKVGRSIKDDVKNIAVFDVAAQKPELRFLIDVSDTVGEEKTYPRLWKLTDENTPPLLNRLNELHGFAAASLEEYASNYVMQRIESIRPGFYEGIKRNLAQSALSDIENDDELKASVNAMVFQSADYLIYSRCGFDTDVFSETFDGIENYNNKFLLYRMGNCATIVAQDFLSECAKILNQLAREKRESHIEQKNDLQPKPNIPSSAPNIKKAIAENIKRQTRKSEHQSNAQLSLFEDETKEQKSDINDEIFTHIAMRGNILPESKKRIYNCFNDTSDTKERVDFLKNEYGVCGGHFEFEGYKSCFWEADSNGIGYGINDGEKKLVNNITWTVFAKYIQNCIDDGIYYIPDTITDDESSVKRPAYKYGDFISLNGEIYEVLDTNEDEQKTDVGNVKYYVSPHTYIMVEAKSWDDFENAELTQPPSNVMPKLEVGTILQYDDSKYQVTRIDEDHVHMLDITYRDNLHPQLMTSESNFVTLALSSAQDALAATQLDMVYTKDDFENSGVRLISKSYGDKTFDFAYAAIRCDRFLMSYSCYEKWTDELIKNGKKEAYRNYLMDKLEYTHKEAVIEAEIMTEAEYDEYYSDDYIVNPNDEFSYKGRNFVVLHVIEETKEVMLRDITNESEANLPLYFVRDIPFVYQRTQAIKDLQNVELQDFLNGEAEFTNVVYGNDKENSTYTYGYLKVQNAVMYMDYTVDNVWSDKDINIGKRRAYRNYLCDAMGYSDKDACIESGLMTEGEYDNVSQTFIPVTNIPNADEIINAPAEETDDTDYQPLLFIPEQKEEKAPEPVFTNRIDYTYSPDDGIGDGGPKAKFKANIEAIRLLNTIEEENRLATADEQNILCRYVGWGGLAETFNEENSSWSDEYKQLKDLLSDSEYKSARASVLCAHYTPPEVIQNIYKAIESFGFKGGNILDPAMGTGLFFAAMPEEIKKNSKLYGYELDDVSGRIAKQLTQNADIKIQGYETNEAPDNFFDVAIGNIPFGDYRIHDPKFNKHKFLIHDYFIAKTLDKVRPGGIIAFITSKGTLDKENDNLRTFVGNKADLVGSVRLPNNTFRQMANTEVTADIIFLQKRERIVSEVPYWTQLGNDESGIPVNAYYEKNPYMLLGKMQYDNRFGENSLTYLKAPENFDLNESLSTALSSLHTVIPDYIRDDEDEATETIPADSDVRNFTFTFVDDKLFYRENSVMRRMDFSGKALERIKAMCELRDITRKLIDAQSEESSDEYISEIQSELNSRYDEFVRKNGNISDSANERVFRDDSDYPLICSLEIYDDESKTYSKADMFYKRTIRPTKTIESVENAVDALKVSLSEKGKVDMDYMCRLYNKPIETVFNELKGQIYINPEKIAEPLPADMNTTEFLNTYGDKFICFETADEYLSGDVRYKLKMANWYAEHTPEIFADNISMLEQVQPPLLSAAEIEVSIGVTWIDAEDYQQFMYDKFNTPNYLQYGRGSISVEYNKFTNAFAVRNKSSDNYSVTATETFGTKRMTSYEIFEASLNMRSATVYDPYEEDGKTKYRVNQRESMLAKEKQGQIEQAFREWIFEQPERRTKYINYYNENFNNIRLRKYDGSFLDFPGMTNDIIMRKHQKNAVARALFSDTNELLDHKVGAGKSFVMVASCMEFKRLGLANKSIMVVPNHLTGQMGAEFLRLYPSAKILVTTKRDFEKKNRLKFISKIATGDWDAVVIGHSQFEKVSMSKERQMMMLEQQVNEIVDAVVMMKVQSGDGITIKQLEKMKSNLTEQIKELADDSQKDDLITFESLGIDYMFVDEAHYFKNCAVFSKMRNVAGIAQTKAKKATDMLMKCRYMQEINNGKGIVFATGTPISNSMTEMYVMQRYLDPKELEKRQMLHFDAWAAQFGEVVTALELAPEGTGYRYRTRFAKFKNMPELLSMYHKFADVVTDEDLDLPIPKVRGGKPTIIDCEPSDFIVLKMMEFVDRANEIHSGSVDSSIDNMLKITNEARLLATDIRLIDPTQDNTPDSKVSLCADNVFKEYTDSSDIKGTQIVFCDIGTPKANGAFNVYDALKQELVLRGIPENEVCFVHDAKNDVQREELFAQMRSGEKRVIIGSTSKLGVGTNIQNRIVALHNLDCPYRPSDIEQRLGRGLRQGNMNDEIGIYTYVTQNTFDAYMWQIVENKQKFISQIKSGKMVKRTCEDIDETVLTFAEVKAIATGDERIKEKMDLDLEISRLQMLKANYENQRYALQDKFTLEYPNAIAAGETFLEKLTADKETYEKNKSEEFSVVIGGKTFTEREEAGKRLMLLAKSVPLLDDAKSVGEFCGFELQIEKKKQWDTISYYMNLCGNLKHSAEMSNSPQGNTIKLENALKIIDDKIEKTQNELESNRKNLEVAKTEYEKPFAYTEELQQKLKRQEELNEELDLSKQDNEVDNEADSSNDEATESKTSEKEVISALLDMPYSRLEKQNYIFLKAMFPEIINGQKDYIKFRKSDYDDMYVEKVGDNTYAICLFYFQNGDMMREPEYTFRLDNENKATRVLTWEMSSLGMYHEVYDYDNPKLYKSNLKKDLDSSFNQTLKDIEKIDYQPCADEEVEADEDCEM